MRIRTLAIKQFYLHQNGGVPEGDESLPNYPRSFQGFLPIRYGEVGVRFEDYYRDFKIEQDLIPKGFIPLGQDSFGNLIVFSVDPSDYGVIYWFEVECDSEDPDEATALVADNIDEFLLMFGETSSERVPEPRAKTPPVD